MSKTEHHHGPENAEFEIKKAYNCVIEAEVTHFWDRRAIEGVNPQEVTEMYRHSFRAYRENDRLAAERWARTAKHLARAFWHEAKIAYLEQHSTELPFLEGASPEALNLHEKSDTTTDLINSVADHIPPGLTEQPYVMTRYLARAREHLSYLNRTDYRHELLRAERIKAAHEYGRVLECMALALEAEAVQKKSA